MNSPCNDKDGGTRHFACHCREKYFERTQKAADALAREARICKDVQCDPWPCKAFNDALAAYEKVRGEVVVLVHPTTKLFLRHGEGKAMSDQVRHAVSRGRTGQGD